MRVTLNQHALKNVLDDMAGPVKAKQAGDILNCVLIEVFPASVSLKVTNQDLGMEIFIKPESVEDTGMVAVNHAQIQRVIGSLDEGEVVIDFDPERSEKCSVEQGFAKFELATYPVDRFPTLPTW